VFDLNVVLQHSGSLDLCADAGKARSLLPALSQVIFENKGGRREEGKQDLTPSQVFYTYFFVV